MCVATPSHSAFSSVSLSSETAGQNHKAAKVCVLIFISFRNLILWKDCLNPSSTLLLCCCWVFANQHLLEKHCSGQFAHVVRVCCASEVAVLTFKLCDHERVNGDDQKSCSSSVQVSSTLPKARSWRGIRN